MIAVVPELSLCCTREKTATGLAFLEVEGITHKELPINGIGSVPGADPALMTIVKASVTGGLERGQRKATQTSLEVPPRLLLPASCHRWLLSSLSSLSLPRQPSFCLLR